jgi:hypothetical protein
VEPRNQLVPCFGASFLFFIFQGGVKRSCQM